MINSVLLLNLSELLISTVFVRMASKLLLKFKTRRARVLVISHIIGRDYTFTDVIVRPVSVGVSSWTDKDGTRPSIFTSFCCMSFENDLRFELGVAFSMDDKLEVVPLTGISTPIADDFIIGAWYAPFWNLYSSSSDDPLGIMLGYRF